MVCFDVGWSCFFGSSSLENLVESFLHLSVCDGVGKGAGLCVVGVLSCVCLFIGWFSFLCSLTVFSFYCLICCLCVCVCVRARVRACTCACVRVYVRA